MKLTKKEKAEIERQQFEINDQYAWETFVGEYLPNLLDLISRAEGLGYGVWYSSGYFKISNENGTVEFPILLKKEKKDWNPRYWFDEFLDTIQREETERELLMQKELAKAEILSRLSKEEREILGFS